MEKKLKSVVVECCLFKDKTIALVVDCISKLMKLRGVRYVRFFV